MIPDTSTNKQMPELVRMPKAIKPARPEFFGELITIDDDTSNITAQRFKDRCQPTECLKNATDKRCVDDDDSTG